MTPSWCWKTSCAIIEHGEKPMPAALQGAREIGFHHRLDDRSRSWRCSSRAVHGRHSGRLLHEFAVVIGVAILVSGFVSLSLTPDALLALPAARTAPAARLVLPTWNGRFFDGMLRLYERTLRVAMRHRLVVLLVLAGSVFGHGWYFTGPPMGFIPNDDNGQIFAVTEAAQGISFDKLAELQEQAAAIVAKKPYVDGFMSSIGSGGPSNATANTGRLFMTLKPRKERPSADNIVLELRKDLSVVPGLRVFPQIVPSIRIGGTITKSQYQFTLFGPDLQALYAAAPKVEATMRTLPQLMDVTSDLYMTNPQVLVNIERDKASALGVTAAQIEVALGNAYSSRQISTIYTSTNQYQVIVETLPEYQQGRPRPQPALSSAPIPASSSRSAPVTQIGQNTGPLTVTHLGQLPSVTISFNLTPGDFARRRHPAHRGSGAQRLCPPASPRRFKARRRRSSSSLQGFFGSAASCRARCLSDPRHPVRELHSSVTILSGLSVRGLRRARGAEHLWLRIECVWIGRHPPAHRHREEKRHHDDRPSPSRPSARRASPRPTRSSRPASCGFGPL
jgi:HAE1 family hydrophobic/amphiphilic exporter-1